MWSVEIHSQNFTLYSPLSKLLSSSALGAVVGTHGGQLIVGLGHEGLQLFLEQLVSGLGGCRLYRGAALGAGLLGPVLILAIAALPAGGTVAAAEIVGPGGVIFPLRLGLQALDGQIESRIVAMSFCEPRSCYSNLSS